MDFGGIGVALGLSRQPRSGHLSRHLELGQDLGGVVAGLWTLEHVHYLAGFIDQERRALQSHIGFAIVLLLAPDAVLANDLVIRVC